MKIEFVTIDPSEVLGAINKVIKQMDPSPDIAQIAFTKLMVLAVSGKALAMIASDVRAIRNKMGA